MNYTVDNTLIIFPDKIIDDRINKYNFIVQTNNKENNMFLNNDLEQIINNYEYILYIDYDTNISLDIINNIFTNKEIVSENTNQIYFNYNPEPMMYDYDDDNILYHKIQTIFLNQNNKLETKIEKKTRKKLEKKLGDEMANKTEHINQINYTDYLNINKNHYYFTMRTSIIRLNEIKEVQVLPCEYNSYNEKKLGLLLFKKGLISVKSKNIILSLKQNIHEPKYTSDITYITGFINARTEMKKSRQSYDYVMESKKILELNVNMYIFISEDLHETVKKIRSEFGFDDKTKYVIINETNLYMYNHKNIIENNCKKNMGPYNNPKYIMAVNARYNYIRTVINENYFGSDYFSWIDFGIGHIVEINKNVPIKTNKNNHKIRLSWISRKKKDGFVYNHETLGGGMFMGDKIRMLDLCNLHDDFFLKLMDKGYCINDDKLLFLIFEQYHELFDTYHSSFNLMYDRMFS